MSYGEGEHGVGTGCGMRRENKDVKYGQSQKRLGEKTKLNGLLQKNGWM